MARVLKLDFTTKSKYVGRHPAFEFANDYRVLMHPGKVIDPEAVKHVDYSGFVKYANKKRLNGADGKKGFAYWNNRYHTTDDPSKWALVEFWRTAEMVGDKKTANDILKAFESVNGKDALKKFKQEGVELEAFAELWSLGPKSSYFNEDAFYKYHFKFGTDVFPSSGFSTADDFTTSSITSKDFKVLQGADDLLYQVCYHGDVWILKAGVPIQQHVACMFGCVAGACLNAPEKLDEDAASSQDGSVGQIAESDIEQLEPVTNDDVGSDDASVSLVVVSQQDGSPVDDGCSISGSGSKNSGNGRYFILVLFSLFAVLLKRKTQQV